MVRLDLGLAKEGIGIDSLVEIKADWNCINWRQGREGSRLAPRIWSLLSAFLPCISSAFDLDPGSVALLILVKVCSH